MYLFLLCCLLSRDFTCQYFPHLQFLLHDGRGQLVPQHVLVLLVLVVVIVPPPKEVRGAGQAP